MLGLSQKHALPAFADLFESSLSYSCVVPFLSDRNVLHMMFHLSEMLEWGIMLQLVYGVMGHSSAENLSPMVKIC